LERFRSTLAGLLAALAAVTVTVIVIPVLASALTQDQHSAATNQQSKKSQVAWPNRQAKAAFFARANC
jgi:hypothetical protein